MSKKARSLVFLGPSDGEKVLLCFKWGVLNYALECRLDGVQNHSRSRPYPCTRAFSDGVSWPSPLLHGREDFWVIIHFCCWVGILCVCFQVDNVLHISKGLTMQNHFHSLLWSYLPRVPIFLTMTVHIYIQYIKFRGGGYKQIYNFIGK